MSSFLALNALYDRVKRSKDRDLKYIALKDMHGEFIRLRQYQTTNGNTNETRDQTSVATNSNSPTLSSNKPITPLLEQSTEKKFNQLLLDCILNEGTDVSDQAARCVAVMIPAEHDDTVSFVVRELVNQIIDSVDVPIEQSIDVDEDIAVMTDADRVKAAKNALDTIIPAIRHRDVIGRVAEENIPRCVKKIRSLNSDLIVDPLSIILLFVNSHSESLSFMHDNLIKFFQTLLSSHSNDLHIQRVSISAIATLAHALDNDDSFNTLIQSVIESNNQITAPILTSIASLSSVRLGRFARPILLSLTSKCSAGLAEAVRSVDEGHVDTEAIEGHMLAIVSIARHLGVFALDREVWQNMIVMLNTAMSFDPNYIGPNVGHSVPDDDGFGDNDDSYFVDDQVDDEFVDEAEIYGGAQADVGTDEDSSSRVRDASCKIITTFNSNVRSLIDNSNNASSDQAIALDRFETIKTTLSSLAFLLLEHVSERVTYVRSDITSTFVDLVDVAAHCGLSLSSLTAPEHPYKAIRVGLDANQVQSKLSSDLMRAMESFYGFVVVVLPVLPSENLREYANELMTHIVRVLEQSQNESLVEAAFSLACAVLQSTNSGLQFVEQQRFVGLVISSLSLSSSRVVDKALACVIAILHRSRSDLPDSTSPISTQPHLTTLHDALLNLITDTSRDRSSKNAALDALSLLYMSFPKLVSTLRVPYAQLHAALEVPLTRVEAAKACVSVLQVTPLVVRIPGSASAAVPSALNQVTASLISLVHHADRTLQHHSLVALTKLILRVVDLVVSGSFTNVPSSAALLEQLRQTVDLVKMLLSHPADHSAHFMDVADLCLALLLMSKMEDSSASGVMLLLAEVADLAVRHNVVIPPAAIQRFGCMFAVASRLSNIEMIEKIRQLCVARLVGTTSRNKQVLAMYAAYAVACQHITLDDRIEKLVNSLSAGPVSSDTESFVDNAMRSVQTGDVGAFTILEVGELARLGLVPSYQIDSLINQYNNSDPVFKDILTHAVASSLMCNTYQTLVARMIALLLEPSNSLSVLATTALAQAAQNSLSATEPVMHLLLTDSSFALRLSGSMRSCNIDINPMIVRMLQLIPDERTMTNVVGAIVSSDDVTLTSGVLRASAHILASDPELRSSQSAQVLIQHIVNALTSSSVAVRSLAVSQLINLSSTASSLILSALAHVIDTAVMAVAVNERFVEEMRYGPVTRRVDTGVAVRMQIFQLLHTLVAATDFAASHLNSSNFVKSVQTAVNDEIDVQNAVCVTLSTALDHLAFTTEQLSTLAQCILHVVHSRPPAEAVASQTDQHLATVAAAKATGSKLLSVASDIRRTEVCSSAQIEELRSAI